MLRALLLLACTAKVAAFAQTPAGEPGCVDLDPDVIQSAYAEAIQDVEVEEGTPTITSCADVAANGGCADEGLAASCCASCALPQRKTYYGRFGFSIDWAIMAAVTIRNTGGNAPTSSQGRAFARNNDAVAAAVEAAAAAAGGGVCSGEAACEFEALRRGLAVGHAQYAFAGSWSTKGCYFYPVDSGAAWAGSAFFGRGGTPAQEATTFVGPPQARLLCIGH